MKDFCFRFLVEDEGIKVDFIQASSSEVIFKVYRADTAVADESKRIIKSSKTSPKSAKKTPIDKALLIKLWNENVHAKEIADRLGTTEGTVYTYAHNIAECVKRTKGKVDYETFRTMWNEEVSSQEIAEKFGISTHSVYSYAKRIPGCKSRRTAKTKIKSPEPLEEKSILQPELTVAPNITPSTEEYPKSGEHLRDNEIKALCKMWHNGQQNVAWLAHYFGVSKSTIYYQLRVNGIRG